LDLETELISCVFRTLSIVLAENSSCKGLCGEGFSLLVLEEAEILVCDEIEAGTRSKSTLEKLLLFLAGTM